MNLIPFVGLVVGISVIFVVSMVLLSENLYDWIKEKNKK